MTNFLKGMCYAAFPHGYDPSTANDTCIWFGSDIASYNAKPLWGQEFSPLDGPDVGKVFKGRDDLGNLKKLGVNLIRLYDWDPRNDHIPFLDYCQELGMQVLVPVSNYFLGAFGPAPDMIESITLLINSFEVNNNYHPAIYGIIIGSELDQSTKVSVDYIVAFTKKWMEIENMAYRDFRKVRIGHPVSFATAGPGWLGYYPCFAYLDKLLPPLLTENTRDLNTRLMICPHTYNEASFLFVNARGAGKGWVDLAYEKYNLPILFCEIGCSRLIRSDYQDVIKHQLVDSIEYKQSNKLLGICYFQYVDKVWMPNTTEGTFGLYKNTDKVSDIVRYGPYDFPKHTDMACKNNYLNIQILEANATLDVLKAAYEKDFLKDVSIDESRETLNDFYNIIGDVIKDQSLPFIAYPLRKDADVSIDELCKTPLPLIAHPLRKDADISIDELLKTVRKTFLEKLSTAEFKRPNRETLAPETEYYVSKDVILQLIDNSIVIEKGGETLLTVCLKGLLNKNID